MLDVGGGMLDVECWMWNVGLLLPPNLLLSVDEASDKVIGWCN